MNDDIRRGVDISINNKEKAARSPIRSNKLIERKGSTLVDEYDS